MLTKIVREVPTDTYYVKWDGEWYYWHQYNQRLIWAFTFNDDRIEPGFDQIMKEW